MEGHFTRVHFQDAQQRFNAHSTLWSTPVLGATNETREQGAPVDAGQTLDMAGKHHVGSETLLPRLSHNWSQGVGKSELPCHPLPFTIYQPEMRIAHSGKALICFQWLMNTHFVSSEIAEVASGCWKRT